LKRKSSALDDTLGDVTHLAAEITAIFGNTAKRLVAARF
jgi:hypothetical protein